MKEIIPVLTYQSKEEQIKKMYLLHSNLNDFIVRGNIFLLYRIIRKSIRINYSVN